MQKDFFKNITIEKLIYIIGFIFYVFLFTRGGDSKYRLALMMIILCIIYTYKFIKFEILKKYKMLYLSGFFYTIMLLVTFLFSENKGDERFRILSIMLLSIFVFLSMINIKLPKKIYKVTIPIISVFSLGIVQKGMEDFFEHRSVLAYHRIFGAMTTIYACEVGIFFVFVFLTLGIYKKKYINILSIVYLILSFIVIYYTKSRSVILMLPITLAFVYFIKNKKNGIILSIIALLFIGFLLKNPLELKGLSRLSSISTIEKMKKDIRVDIFKEGIIKGKENLILGEGFYKHKDSSFSVREGASHPHYHNIFIETFATQGVITFIFYVLFLANIFIYMIKNYIEEKDIEIKNIRLIPIGVFVFAILYGLIEPIFYFSKIYMILFTIISLNFIKIKKED